MGTTVIRQPHLEFAPPPDPGGARALGLALVVHALLLLALTWGIHWNSQETELAVEAELWSALPQAAAPKLVEPEPVAPPEPPPPPPRPTKVEPPKPSRDADIAIARKKKEELLAKERARAEEERKARQLKDKQDKERKEKDRKEKERKEREERLEKEKRDKEKRDKQAQKDKADKEKDKRQQAEETQRLEKQRQENLKRMAGMANASGAPQSTGTAAKSSGPSDSYAGRIRNYIKPKLVFTEEISTNTPAEVEVRQAPDGTVVGRTLVKSSGNKAWDEAVLKAIDKTEKLPRDIDGQVHSPLIISFRPRD